MRAATTSLRYAARVSKLSKTFEATVALADVGFDLHAGKVTALLGMNGSGKSTLIKILAGLTTPDRGAELEVFGHPVQLPLDPSASHAIGLRFLHQDVGLVPALTVADNFALGHSFPVTPVGSIRSAQLHRRLRRTLDFLGIALAPQRLVADLGPTERTMLAIARAIQDESDESPFLAASILVLDEPTASLPAHEVETVLELIANFRKAGGTVLYVSHRMDEVERIADRCIVLRDGRLVADDELGGRNRADLVRAVIDRDVTVAREASRPAPGRDQSPGMVVRGLTGSRLTDVSFSAGKGEVLGIGGLVGCGRSELIRMLAGLQKPIAGEMAVDGSAYAPKSPGEAIGRGVACVPQDRRSFGSIPEMSVGENLSLGHLARYTRLLGLLDRRREHTDADRTLTSFRVRSHGPAQRFAHLSGGNQQKVVLARASAHEPTVLLLDEPTQGIDAVAKSEVWRLVRELTGRGMSVVVGSTDMEELAEFADRVLLLDRGRLTAVIEGSDLTERNLNAVATGEHATGLVPGKSGGE